MSQVFVLLSKVASQLLFYVLAKLSTQVKVYGFYQLLHQKSSKLSWEIYELILGNKQITLLAEPWWLSWLERHISLTFYTYNSKVEGSNPGVIYFRRLNKSNLNTLGRELAHAQTNLIRSRMRSNSVFGKSAKSTS